MISRQTIVKLVSFGVVALHTIPLLQNFPSFRQNLNESQEKNMTEQILLALSIAFEYGIKVASIIPFSILEYSFLEKILSTIINGVTPLTWERIRVSMIPPNFFNYDFNYPLSNPWTPQNEIAIGRLMRGLEIAMRNVQGSPINSSVSTRSNTISESVPPRINRESLSTYSVPMERYIQKFEQQKDNCSQIQSLTIPEKEVEKYIDFITTIVMNRPVRLYGRPYDLNTLLKIPVTQPGFGRKDPTTGDVFYLRDIQPANDIQLEIETIINKYREEKLKRADQIAIYGINFFKKGNFIEAEQKLKLAIEISTQAQNKNESERLALYHYNLASTYGHLRMYQDAVAHCKISLDMRTKLFGASNEATKRTHIKLKDLEDKLLVSNEESIPLFESKKNR